MRYIIGSNLLNLKNTQDKDYLEINNNYEYSRFIENGNDILKRSRQNIERSLSFPLDIPIKECLFNYQLDKDIIKQNFPIDYRVLDYRKEAITFLKHLVEEKYSCFNDRIYVEGDVCLKEMYHVAYLYFIIVNSSTLLTTEQQDIIQRIHDGTMHILYAQELANKINAL